MSIFERGLYSQVKLVFGKKKGGLWSLLTRGLYSEGKYRVISLGGILGGLCWEGVLVRGWSLGQVRLYMPFVTRLQSIKNIYIYCPIYNLFTHQYNIGKMSLFSKY